MLVEVTAFAADAVATARLLLVHDRLADMLGTLEELDVRGARVMALADGRTVPMEALSIDLGVIHAIATEAPRGNVGRRLGTLVHPAIAQVGPYRVTGGLHGPPSMDAFEVARRRTWVPITDADVAYRVGDREAHVSATVVLLHRPHVATLVPDADQVAVRSRRVGARTGWPTEMDDPRAWR